jgi:hypothetical protein
MTAKDGTGAQSRHRAKASDDIIPRLEAWLARDAVPLPPGAGVRVAGGAEMTREVQQHLDELAVYLDVLQQIEPRGISLEIGFYRGGTHFAWSQLFAEVISIESDHLACHKARVEFPHPSSRVVHGDSTKPETFAAVHDILVHRPVDHLFIDGDYHTPSIREYFQPTLRWFARGG